MNFRKKARAIRKNNVVTSVGKKKEKTVSFEKVVNSAGFVSEEYLKKFRDKERSKVIETIAMIGNDAIELKRIDLERYNH